MKNILIVDDSSFMRNWLKNIIGKQLREFQVVAEAKDGLEAIEKYEQY
ncbi:response regulator [Salinibacillus xinjiangensis]|nr:hypothetical protein [Salinibacillus xinjiangensis]